MQQAQHIERVRNYYFNSRFGYRYLLWGSQHFGFYPKNKHISEKEAQVLMQDLIGEKLNLSKSMKVLDAGCGRGVVANYLAKKFGCSIEAVDITPMLIEEAKVWNSSLQNVNFSLMDYSSNRLRRYLLVPYSFVKLSNSHEKNPNPTIAVEWFKFMKKGLWRYNIFSAYK